MDREAPDKTDDKLSDPEQNVEVKLNNVEELQAKQVTEITESSPVEVNTSSNLKNRSLLQLEMPESEYQDDLIAHSLQHSILQNSLKCHKELNTMKSELHTSDLGGEIVETQPIMLQHSDTKTSVENVDILEKLAVSHITVDSSFDEAEVCLTHSISSAVSNVSSSPIGQDGGVIPNLSSTEVIKSSEERKDNLTQGQSESEAEFCSPESVSDTYLKLCNPRGTVLYSDLNAFVSETQLTVSCLETQTADKTTVPAEAAATCSDHESVYYIKWVMFGQRNVPIVTQNENGPCPLLAIMNVLLLKEKVKLAPMLEMITSEQLMTYLGECIFENMPQNLSETTQANYEQNMQDAMSVMYKLQTGLDVNVKFTGVRDFEYTPELIIFDLLEISLYHGWLVEPQDSDTVTAINHCSYNQLVEKIISLRQSQEEENVTQALIAEQFLDRTASQLTYHGLCELSSVIKEKELCVFFRNNHFNTLYKHNNELFLLVTDQGFLTECNVVWETLSNVDGDCHFTDATFRTYTKPAPSTVPIPDPGVPFGSPEQIDHDYQVALFLQEEDASVQSQAWESGLQHEQATYAYADHEFAVRLQEEENRRVTGEQPRTTGTAVLDYTLSQQQSQGRYLVHGSPSEGQHRRADRGERKEKEEKSCSVL